MRSQPTNEMSRRNKVDKQSVSLPGATLKPLCQCWAIQHGWGGGGNQLALSGIKSFTPPKCRPRPVPMRDPPPPRQAHLTADSGCDNKLGGGGGCNSQVLGTKNSMSRTSHQPYAKKSVSMTCRRLGTIKVVGLDEDAA